MLPTQRIPGDSMTTGTMTGTAPATSDSEVRRVVFASSIGTIIEWYDFLIYGTAAALVFNKLFFPAVDPFLGTLAALGSAAVGFFARPFGGAVFGYFGDRLGRKSMLLLTLVIMGLGTFAIGLLPTYDQIGIWAPILLITLRIIQGIGLGGEWGGAALMVLEHAPKHRRGFCGSLVQVGFPIGLILSASVFAFVSKLPEDQFLSWGWRVPFISSLVLVALGTFIRVKVAESPVFLEMKARNEVSRNPFTEAIFKNPRSFLIAVGLKICEVSWVYMLTVFLVVYATKNLGLPKSLMLDAIMIAAAIEIVTIPLFGYLIATIAVALSFGHGLMFGPQATYFPELFGARVRYTGASFGFQVSAAIGGGLTPVLATVLVNQFGGTTGVSIMLIVLALITMTAAFFAPETQDQSVAKL
jgi:MHS family shikimate/dehydroshikimate transporter-like MFS transporter